MTKPRQFHGPGVQTEPSTGSMTTLGQRFQEASMRLGDAIAEIRRLRAEVKALKTALAELRAPAVDASDDPTTSSHL